MRNAEDVRVAMRKMAADITNAAALRDHALAVAEAADNDAMRYERQIARGYEYMNGLLDELAGIQLAAVEAMVTA